MGNTIDLAVASGSALVSIVIPCCGMIEYTRLCVPSVLRYSRAPFELIFLDVGSLDGTNEYLAGLRESVRVEVCRAATDLDISEACKDALRKARGAFVCLLNNDTLVTPSWLEGLNELTKLSEAHGLVGPMSNYAAPPQRVETVPYRAGPKKGWRPGEPLVDVAAVQNFAKEFAAARRATWGVAERLGGFCLLLRRDVLTKVTPGPNEPTDLGLFDTDVVSMKARAAGYTPAYCGDLFVHHFGTRTFVHGAPAAHVEANGQG